MEKQKQKRVEQRRHNFCCDGNGVPAVAVETYMKDCRAAKSGNGNISIPTSSAHLLSVRLRVAFFKAIPSVLLLALK